MLFLVAECLLELLEGEGKPSPGKRLRRWGWHGLAGAHADRPQLSPRSAVWRLDGGAVTRFHPVLMVTSSPCLLLAKLHLGGWEPPSPHSRARSVDAGALTFLHAFLINAAALRGPETHSDLQQLQVISSLFATFLHLRARGRMQPWFPSSPPNALHSSNQRQPSSGVPVAALYTRAAERMYPWIRRCHPAFHARSPIICISACFASVPLRFLLLGLGNCLPHP